MDRSHVPAPLSSSSSFLLALAPRLLDPQSVFQGRGSMPCGEGSEFAKIWGIAQPRPHRLAAQCDVLA